MIETPDVQRLEVPGLGEVNRVLNRIADYLEGLSEAARPFNVQAVKARTTTSAAVSAGVDGYSDADTFPAPFRTRRIDVAVFGPQNLVYQTDDGTGHWSDAAELPQGGTLPYTVPAAISRIRVKSADITGVAQSRYCITFWN